VPNLCCQYPGMCAEGSSGPFPRSRQPGGRPARKAHAGGRPICETAVLALASGLLMLDGGGYALPVDFDSGQKVFLFAHEIEVLCATNSRPSEVRPAQEDRK